MPSLCFSWPQCLKADCCYANAKQSGPSPQTQTQKLFSWKKMFFQQWPCAGHLGTRPRTEAICWLACVPRKVERYQAAWAKSLRYKVKAWESKVGKGCQKALQQAPLFAKQHSANLWAADARSQICLMQATKVAKRSFLLQPSWSKKFLWAESSFFHPFRKEAILLTKSVKASFLSSAWASSLQALGKASCSLRNFFFHLPSAPSGPGPACSAEASFQPSFPARCRSCATQLPCCLESSCTSSGCLRTLRIHGCSHVSKVLLADFTNLLLQLQRLSLQSLALCLGSLVMVLHHSQGCQVPILMLSVWQAFDTGCNQFLVLVHTRFNALEFGHLLCCEPVINVVLSDNILLLVLFQDSLLRDLWVKQVLVIKKMISSLPGSCTACRPFAGHPCQTWLKSATCCASSWQHPLGWGGASVKRPWQQWPWKVQGGQAHPLVLYLLQVTFMLHLLQVTLSWGSSCVWPLLAFWWWSALPYWPAGFYL